jgi:hypothetical protein
MEMDDADKDAKIGRLTLACQAVLDGISYETPAGYINCRFCDADLDHAGTFRDMHEQDCVIHTIREAMK